MSRRRILLVEDDGGVAQMLRYIASKWESDFTLDLRESVVSAKSALATFLYDAVISDYQLLDGTGVDVLRHAAKVQASATRMLWSAADRTSEVFALGDAAPAISIDIFTTKDRVDIFRAVCEGTYPEGER